MIISIIVAIGKNRVVGINNKLPWNLPADMEHFRQLTMGKPVIMGQKTFESVGRPLSGRINIILTLDQNFQAEGCIIAHSIKEALTAAKKQGAAEVMIAGGVSIYSQFLPLADKMYLTQVEGDFEGDAFFPEFDWNDWEELERIENEADKNNPYRYSFVTLQKKITMVLGVKKLLELVKEKNLVENLSERELNSPEGAGFDLRIGELYKIKGKGFLGIEQRETPEMELVAKYEEGKTIKAELEPRTYYAMKTIESVNMPDNLLAIMTPRSTLFRSGVYIFGGQTPPGYKGGLIMGIYNFRDEPFDLEMGSRVVHIMFFEVKGDSNLYRGQWQGGRVTTNEKEKQV